MKKFIILLAFVGLLSACHRGDRYDNRGVSAGAPATETGTVQGGGSSDNQSNTNNIIIPQTPNY